MTQRKLSNEFEARLEQLRLRDAELVKLVRDDQVASRNKYLEKQVKILTLRSLLVNPRNLKGTPNLLKRVAATILRRLGLR